MEKNFWVWVIGALVIGLLVGHFVAPATKPAQMEQSQVSATSEANKAVVQGLFGDVDRADLDAMDNRLSSDYVFHFAGNPAMDKAGHRQLVTALRTGFPDIKHTIEAQFVDGNMVSTRGYFEGTHNGVFQGAQPTGKRVKVTFIFVERIADGKIAEEWVNLDSAGLLQQIGALPSPGK